MWQRWVTGKGRITVEGECYFLRTLLPYTFNAQLLEFKPRLVCCEYTVKLNCPSRFASKCHLKIKQDKQDQSGTSGQFRLLHYAAHLSDQGLLEKI